MKTRRALRAVVTIQAAHVPSSTPLNPYVHIVVMIPKGKTNVTVPTNCTTRVVANETKPVWNQTFSLPVRRASDALVFRVFDRERGGSGSAVPRLRRASSAARSEAFAGLRSWSVRGSAGEGGDDGVGEEECGRVLGASLFPIDLIPTDGTVVRRRLELFEDLAVPVGVGSLYIAAKLEEIEVKQWEKADLDKNNLLSQFHRSRLTVFEDRFIGIGELAAFLYEEGYSPEKDANWDRAVTILSEQLAYRMYETTESTADRANFLAAKAQIERDQGLWDGI